MHIRANVALDLDLNLDLARDLDLDLKPGSGSGSGFASWLGLLPGRGNGLSQTAPLLVQRHPTQNQRTRHSHGRRQRLT
jgi:hypothetical protein